MSVTWALYPGDADDDTSMIVPTAVNIKGSPYFLKNLFFFIMRSGEIVYRYTSISSDLSHGANNFLCCSRNEMILLDDYIHRNK
jgi:hypothetical protein